MISYDVSGDWERTERFFAKAQALAIRPYLEKGGAEGVAALREATPVLSGEARAAWGYRIQSSNGNYRIDWVNGNIENGFKVVISLQYGHGTGTGGYVQGRDLINPAMKPIFDRIADGVWKAVTSL